MSTMRCCCSAVAVCADCATAPNNWPTAARRLTCPGSAPSVISSHGAVSIFSATARPSSVSSKSFLLPSDWLAIHIQVQDRVFRTDLLGVSKLTNNMEASLGATVFF